MRIKRNPGKEKWILRKATEWLNSQERSAGIHVSDLLYPRKWYWRQQPKYQERTLTETEVGYFIAGQSAHYILAAMVVGRKDGADEGELCWNDIWYRPDIREPLVEIKSTRKRQAPPKLEATLKREFETYLNQLRMYAAAENQPDAALLVFYLNEQHEYHSRLTFPKIYYWEVHFTKRELEGERAGMEEVRDAMQQCKNHKTLPLCPDWMCGKMMDTDRPIPTCPYWGDCKPEGRYRETQAKLRRQRATSRDGESTSRRRVGRVDSRQSLPRRTKRA